MKYAPSTGCFYITGTDGIPNDAFDINDADYQTAMALPSSHTYKFQNGVLTVYPPEPESFINLLTEHLANVRATRSVILGRVMDIAFVEKIAGNDANVQTALSLRQQLLDITTRQEVLAAIAAQSIDDVRSTIKTAYKTMAGTAPTWLRTAFNQVDA